MFFKIYLAVGIILLFAVWNNILAYAQQTSSSPTISPPSTASSNNAALLAEIKAKLCNPSNPSLKVVNTTEARVCGIPKTVQPALGPSSAATPPSIAPLAHPFKNTGSSNNTSMITTSTSNVPIVLRPIPSGICPTGYHLVSGTVCIKDTPSSTQQQTIPAALIPTTTTMTSPVTTQSSHNNPTQNDNENAVRPNNEENFHTKILKSFNKKFK
ncbi:MAG TPA: hypothetical protein VJ729_14890 [Nitrososphaeraceae archaeon]|nr:hypothetical protein [Nitrososphaeraceae archaeon]